MQGSHLKLVEQDVQHEAGQLIQRCMDRAEEEAKNNALKVTLQAIQRYASEHTADSTVSAIAIPSDDMKGRVIGREGRNIRAFEKATGVDVIVDDTPGVVVVSCFDPVRRAIASESLQKLLEDGRIHPTRIEEVVDQMQKEMATRIVKFGRDACIEADVQGVNPKISEMMGRLQYRTSYGQNILRHSMEVAYLCQVIADELGLDLDDRAEVRDFCTTSARPWTTSKRVATRPSAWSSARNTARRKRCSTPSAGTTTTSRRRRRTPRSSWRQTLFPAPAPDARSETLEKYVKRLGAT